MTAPRLSVVVTAHNAAETIGECLTSLAAQLGVAPGEVELILVDDRSTDGTAARARALALPGLRVIRTHETDTPRSVAQALSARQHALDAGIRAARADLIALTDADADAPRDWLRTLRSALSSADLVAGPVTFHAATHRRGSVAARVLAGVQTADAAFYFTWCRALASLGAPAGVFFGNAAFRRAAYDRVGEFTGVGFSLTEDLAFARAVWRAGGQLRFVRRPAVGFRGCDRWRTLVSRTRRTSAGPVSALSVSLGAWAASLVALGVLAGLEAFGLAPIGGASWRALLGGRLALGSVVTAVSLASTGSARRMGWALLYEPIAVAVGAGVLVTIVAGRPIQWGGHSYARR